MKQSVEIVSEFSAELLQLQYPINKVAVIVDEHTKSACYPLVKPYLPSTHILIETPSGEEHKTLATCNHIWEALTVHEFTRKSLVINLGGGVIGDMGGFCAATYKRGIPFIQVPTTLLAQVDASIGGKLGVDFQAFKNHIGTFQMPNRVVIYPEFLQTLPFRELRSGYAEVLKHALIAQKSAWETLRKTNLEAQNWAEVITESYRIKYRIVEADPKEQGLRKVLNFGHTVGHAIESHFLHHPQGRLLHGEAIAIGMICEAFLSHKTVGLNRQSLDEITAYILSIYGKVALNPDDFPQFISLMKQDKKNETQEINFSLLEKIGKATFNHQISVDMIEESLQYYHSLS